VRRELKRKKGTKDQVGRDKGNEMKEKKKWTREMKSEGE
jgi:hypothetical protein